MFVDSVLSAKRLLPLMACCDAPACCLCCLCTIQVGMQLRPPDPPIKPTKARLLQRGALPKPTSRPRGRLFEGAFEACTALATSEHDVGHSGQPGPEGKRVNYMEAPLKQVHVTRRASSCAKRGGGMQLCLKPGGQTRDLQDGVTFSHALHPPDRCAVAQAGICVSHCIGGAGMGTAALVRAHHPTRSTHVRFHTERVDVTRPHHAHITITIALCQSAHWS